MRIAVTGGICDGKSTVAGMLTGLGFPVVSADSIVSELYAEPGFVQKMTAALGSEAATGGKVNREWLRARASLDPAWRRRLNLLVHGPVLARLLERIAEHGDRTCFAEVPLLIETATQGKFDRVWVVYAGEPEQRRRLAQRLGGNEPLAAGLLAAQLATGAKLPFADRIVRTDQGAEAVKLLVTRLVAELQ